MLPEIVIFDGTKWRGLLCNMLYLIFNISSVYPMRMWPRFPHEMHKKEILDKVAHPTYFIQLLCVSTVQKVDLSSTLKLTVQTSIIEQVAFR